MSGASDFLVEIGTEELPPKALDTLSRAFADGVRQGLGEARLEFRTVHRYASPRRLAVLVELLQHRQPDREVSQKGPPLAVAFADGQPTRAALAFAERCGVAVGDLGREKSDAGEWLSWSAKEAGKPAAELLPAIVAGALDALPIPRRMRWGSSEVEFVRPVHWVVMLHGEEVVPCCILGIAAGRSTRGHRFMSDGEIELPKPADYVGLLRDRGRVMADFAERRRLIVDAVAGAAAAAGGSPVATDDLYDEVAALTEWPVPLTGTFDEDFLALPDEAIIATLTHHQRYFPVRGADGRLLPVFVALANIESREPERVRDGNERVIRPRLADARFFWDTDRQVPLGERAEALKRVVYQQGLGSLHDKSMRVAALTSMLAEQVGADGSAGTRAAVLAKCDLLSGMVGEFPELQGTMGAYYAAAAGEDTAVASAIGEQYLPRFAGDALPASDAGRILAVADKLDTLAGIFVLGKKPSGNRDPFGLRRAALGIVRIVLETDLDIDLRAAIGAAVAQQPSTGSDGSGIRAALYEFMVERLKSHVLDQYPEIDADMFEAVRARRPGSFVDFRDRLAAVQAFASLDSALSLTAANKRTANILRQAGAGESPPLDPGKLAEDAERVLFHAMQAARNDVLPLIESRSYTAALTRLAELRVPVDAFFDGVMVMTDDDAIRANRLALLAELRSLFLNVADLSRLTPVQE